MKFATERMIEMTYVKNFLEFINEIAPFELQESYDNSGLIVGNGENAVSKAIIALDVTAEVALEAVKSGADLIITHHPLIFRAVKRIDTKTPLGLLLANGVSVISAHTNFDSAKMNEILAEKLDLVPAEPLAVENGVPFGLICQTKQPLAAGELAEQVKNALGNKVVRFNSFNGGKISRVALCSGSGGSFLENVLSKKSDCYITGDVKHDIFIDAHNAGLCVIDAGHFHTENIFCEYMRSVLTEKFPNTEIKVADSNCDILEYV